MIEWKHIFDHYPDTKVHGANMGPMWGRQDPGGPHVGPMNLAIWVGPGKTTRQERRKNTEINFLINK